MNIFANKSLWKKVIINLWGLEPHDLQAYGWAFTDKLWLATKAPMFFAHYSDRESARVEIKVALDWTLEHFKEFFGTPHEVGASAINSITMEPFGGSPAHAQAYLLSRELRGAGEELTKDALHWALNMTGYSYAQEIRILAEHVAHMAGNLEKVTT